MAKKSEGVNPDWLHWSDDEKLNYYNDQMLVESKEAGETEPGTEPTKEEPVKDNSPEALITKTGRLSIGRRLAYMGSQMMTGLKVFWKKNKAWIIGIPKLFGFLEF